MYPFNIVLVNGMPYQCQKSKITLHRPLSERHDLVGLLMQDLEEYALLEVKKASPLSAIVKGELIKISKNGLIPAVECIADNGDSIAGDFLIESMKAHKKGLVSFTAKLVGQITYTPSQYQKGRD